MPRPILVIVIAVVAAGCSNSATGPSSSIGSQGNIGGSWTGTLSSTNNPTETITMELSQSSRNISGSWSGTAFAWTGQVTGTLSGSSFSGQLTFRGVAADESVCTGTASVSGTASATALSWTSGAGVVGGACSAPLPTGLTLNLTR